MSILDAASGHVSLPMVSARTNENVHVPGRAHRGVTLLRLKSWIHPGRIHLELPLQSLSLESCCCHALAIRRIEDRDRVAEHHQVSRYHHLLIKPALVRGSPVRLRLEQRRPVPHQLRASQDTVSLSAHIRLGDQLTGGLLALEPGTAQLTRCAARLRSPSAWLPWTIL